MKGKNIQLSHLSPKILNHNLFLKRMSLNLARQKTSQHHMEK